MLLKEISIMGLANSSYDVVTFNKQAHCVEDLYLRKLLPYRNNFISKLNIILIGKDDRERFSSTGLNLEVFQYALSIGEVFLNFDFESYGKVNEYNKKLMVLNKIEEGLEIFSSQVKIESLPFKEACQRCLEDKLENEMILKDNLVSKNKEYSATVKLRLDFEKLQATAFIKNLIDGKQVEKIFFTEDPEILFSQYFLGTVKWTDKNAVTLFDKKGKHKWTVTI